MLRCYKHQGVQAEDMVIHGIGAHGNAHGDTDNLGLNEGGDKIIRDVKQCENAK